MATTTKTLIEQDLDLVGVGFRLKKDVREMLADLVARRPRKVELVREQENKYDINAIKVIYADSGPLLDHHLGYLRATTAEILAPKMDEGEVVVEKAHLVALHAAQQHKEGVVHVILRKLA